MSPAHIHLLITHLPIFGALIGSLVLAYAIIIKSNDTKIAAYGVLVLSTFGARIAYLTGEGAEEVVEEIPGVVESTIETHENFALIALIGLLILGLLSVIGLIAIVNKSTYGRKIAIVVLITAIISFGLVAITGYLGGEIRHTEMASDFSIQSNQLETNLDFQSYSIQNQV
jgi:uncharacterized membrane protein